MTLREAAPIPGAFDFTRFVASSITFMTYLSEVSIYFDDKRLSKLTKASGVPRMLDIPKGLKRSSGSNIMHTTGIKLTRMCLCVTVSSAFHLLYIYQHCTLKPRLCDVYIQQEHRNHRNRRRPVQSQTRPLMAAFCRLSRPFSALVDLRPNALLRRCLPNPSRQWTN